MLSDLTLMLADNQLSSLILQISENKIKLS